MKLIFRQMLDELRDMLVERLLVYEKKNKVLPQRIFVYRDGVSEVCPRHRVRYCCTDTIFRTYRANLTRLCKKS
jgi:hypothetical protein